MHAVITIKLYDMQKISHSDYLSLRENTEVIEKDSYGDKVLLRPDGSYIKIFRRKRLISSATLYPYAQRFVDNAEKLKALGIPCPEVIALYRAPSIKRDIVYYKPLPGNTLRQIIQGKAQGPKNLKEQFLAFVKKVQDLGIFFRSMHLGNVVLTPEGKLGLIDFSDMKIQKRPLSRLQRQRNQKHIERYEIDAKWLKEP